MKVAILDAPSGISGDMFLGSFLDAGFDLNLLRREIAKIKIRGIRISKRRMRKGAFVGTKFDVKFLRKLRGEAPFKEIHRRISGSRLHPNIKKIALRIFVRLTEAESRVHGVRKPDILFHEPEALDTLVDVVGAAVCLHHWKIEKVFVRNLCIGEGEGRIHQRKIVLPAPASWSLLSGFRVSPVKVRHEMVTPTGAAILAEVGEKTDDIPSIVVEKVGYGAGDADFKGRSNLLRLTVGELASSFKQDRILVLETNLDDMNPQGFEILYERLFRAGALDVFVTPILMKKMRPAFKISVLFEHPLKEKISEVVFHETPSFGVRFLELDRFVLERRIEKVETKYGPVRVKLGWLDSKTHLASPEYEDCKRIALRRGLPFREIYREAQKKALAVLRPA